MEAKMNIVWFQAAAAIYLVLGSLMIDANSNTPSRFVFKVIPMCIGLPLAVDLIRRWIE